jgi:hypothetical protein
MKNLMKNLLIYRIALVVLFFTATLLASLTFYRLDSVAAGQFFRTETKNKDRISGEWKATFELQGTTVPVAFELKLDGNKITGTVNSAHTGAGTISKGAWSAKDKKLKFTRLSRPRINNGCGRAEKRRTPRRRVRNRRNARQMDSRQGKEISGARIPVRRRKKIDSIYSFGKAQ